MELCGSNLRTLRVVLVSLLQLWGQGSTGLGTDSVCVCVCVCVCVSFVDGCVDGWMDGWMDGCVCMCVYVL